MFRQALVIGLGVSGCSAAQFLLERGCSVTGIDDNQDIIHQNVSVIELVQKGLQVYHSLATIHKAEVNCAREHARAQTMNQSQLNEQLHSFPLAKIKEFDVIVVSPGIPPSNLYYQAALEAGIEVVGEIELICREINQKCTKKCVGVTGTNGKTTVTLLITHVLNYAGIEAIALGNIGEPLIHALNSNADVFVLELSSYQLETLKSPCLDVAVLLNITPDHLDRYDSFNVYAQTKISIEHCLKPGAHLYVDPLCLAQYSSLFRLHQHRAYKTIELSLKPDMDEFMTVAVKPSHDLENIYAAYSVCSSLGVSNEVFAEALKSFKKPPHRIEFVRHYAGVDYYDDSKGTNIDAVIRAVESINKSIVLIAGGVDKGFPYTSWIKAFGSKVKSICVIGESSKKIQQQLSHAVPVFLCKTLEEAVNQASRLAISGEAVLLSPGCASFDMFRDYAHRGCEFQKIVKEFR